MEKSNKLPSKWEHLKAILQLPFMVMIVIPFLIKYFFKEVTIFSIQALSLQLSYLIGGIFLLVGIILFVLSVDLFVKIGMGTLAPWNPTQKLVVKSLYQYLRNPMLLGVILILVGEAFLFRSSQILIWAFVFFMINHVYFIFKEEPDLGKRFGEEYMNYKKNVPRWIPRVKPWIPEEVDSIT